MPEGTPPSEGERSAFVAKLAGFRNRLSLREQKMLDALVSAALEASSLEERAHYWIDPRPESNEPPASPSLT
jgi:hypothetical protein